MKWITKPNKYYDKIEEPLRFLTMIGLYLLCVLIGISIGKLTNNKDISYLIGMVLFCLIGLYRINYFLINDLKKLKCLIELGKGEQVLIISKGDKRRFLQVSCDEYDDICCVKRDNLK